jgi:Uma2 family endonuclease
VFYLYSQRQTTEKMEQPQTRQPYYTVADYLRLEEQAEQKHHYLDGYLITAAGGSVSHGTIGGNIQAELRNVLRGKPCRAFNSDVQIAVSARKYLYPDASVVCGEPLFHITNPHAPRNAVLIIEVVSESTGDFDRGEKFALYRQIPTFQEYVLIEQEKPQVTVYYKLEPDVWRMTFFLGLDKIVYLQTIDAQILMREIYLNIELPTDPISDTDEDLPETL